MSYGFSPVSGVVVCDAHTVIVVVGAVPLSQAVQSTRSVVPAAENISPVLHACLCESLCMFALYRSLCMIHTLSQRVLPPFTRVVLHDQLGPCRHFRRDMEPPDVVQHANLLTRHMNIVYVTEQLFTFGAAALPSSQRNWTASRTGAAHQPRIHMVCTSFERVVEQQSIIRSD